MEETSSFDRYRGDADVVTDKGDNTGTGLIRGTQPGLAPLATILRLWKLLN